MIDDLIAKKQADLASMGRELRRDLSGADWDVGLEVSDLASLLGLVRELIARQPLTDEELPFLNELMFDISDMTDGVSTNIVISLSNRLRTWIEKRAR